MTSFQIPIRRGIICSILTIASALLIVGCAPTLAARNHERCQQWRLKTHRPAGTFFYTKKLPSG